MKKQKKLFQIAALFLALPILLRLGIQIPIALESSTVFQLLGGFLVGISQDIIITIQIIVIGFLIKVAVEKYLKKASKNIKTTIIATSVAIVWGLAHFFYGFDLFMLRFLKTRMSWELLEFVKRTDSFISSIQYMGGVSVIATVVVLLALIVVVGKRIKKYPELIQFNRSIMLILSGAIGVAIAGSFIIPDTTRYWLNNSIYTDQVTTISDIKARLTNSSQLQTLASLEPFLSPQAEVYTRKKSNYPLLKWTSQFTNEKQFEINIDPDDKPHLIFLFLESFRAHNVGSLNGKPGASPNFDKLSKEGVLFTQAYANGIQTTRAVMATLFGVYPKFSKKAVQSSQFDIPLIGVQDLFKNRGYHTAFIHNGSLKFEKKQLFFPNHGFDKTLGYKQILRQRKDRLTNPIKDQTSWGIHDEHLMQFATDYLEAMDQKNQPTFMTMFTVSHHHPWKPPSKFNSPEYPHITGEYKNFLKTYYYTDHALGQFIDKLKEKNLYNKSIIVVLADTAQPMGEHHDNFGLINYLYEENVRIPLLILAPGRLKEPKVITDIASQVDILPTIMDVYNMQDYNHAVGTSLVRKVSHRHVLFNNPFSMGYIGARLGNKKFVYTAYTKKTSLFDLSTDPNELNTTQTKKTTAAFINKVISTTEFMNLLYDQKAYTP